MLPKPPLTSHYRTSGSRRVITPSCLTGLWRSLVYHLSAYSCTPSWFLLVLLHWYHFCPLLCPSAWKFPLVFLIFLKWSVSFPFYLFSLFLGIDNWGRFYLSLLFFGNTFKYSFHFHLASQIFSASASSFCLFAFLFLGDCPDHCFLYNVINLHP